MGKYTVLFGLLLVGSLGLAQAPPGGECLPPAEDEIASMQAAFGEVIDFFATFIQESKEHFLTLDTSFAGLSARVDGLAQDVEYLGARIDDHESRITTLEEIDLGSVQRRILALEEARQALQIKIDNNRAKVDGVEAALGGFRSDIESINTSIFDLGASLEAQGAELAALQEEVASLKAAQESQWGAIILVPVLVGALVYFLLQGQG